MKKEIKDYQKLTRGVRKWVRMMVKSGEIKIGDDKKVGKEIVFGWTGEDEVEASILGYIRKEGIFKFNKLKQKR